MELDGYKPERKKGSSPFHTGGTQLGIDCNDYWSWALSDMLSNTARGVLAEFLVGHALDVVKNDMRSEWDSFDLLYCDKKIEVKCSSYLQTWKQTKLSTIQFDVGKHKELDPNTGKYSLEATRPADVYVFCLLNEKCKSKVDPMDLSQWLFWVVPTECLNKRNQKKAGLNTIKSIVKRITGDEAGLPYDQLKPAVDAALSRA